MAKGLPARPGWKPGPATPPLGGVAFSGLLSRPIHGPSRSISVLASWPGLLTTFGLAVWQAGSLRQLCLGFDPDPHRKGLLETFAVKSVKKYLDV